QLLKRRLSEPKDVLAIEAIELAARRGENLTRQLLTFSRRQHLTPSVIRLQERLEIMREMLARSLGERFDVVISILSDIWPVEIDLTEFELALVNIAVNARDAMPQGGIITITAENGTVRTGELPAPELEGEFVALTVADTGVGI